MKMRYLTATLLAMLSVATAHAQSGPGFPTLSPVPGTGQLTDDPTITHFTFIAAGDNRPSGHTAKQPPTLSQIMQDSKQYKPVFMLWSGDMIAGFRTPTKIDRKLLKSQYDEFFKIAATAGVPMFNSPGNHEMDTVAKSKHETVETPDADMEQLYLEVMNIHLMRLLTERSITATRASSRLTLKRFHQSPRCDRRAEWLQKT